MSQNFDWEMNRIQQLADERAREHYLKSIKDEARPAKYTLPPGLRLAFPQGYIDYEGYQVPTGPPPEPVQQVISECEKLLVERVEHSSGIHYLILICKRHGQLGEEMIRPALLWQTQKRLGDLFNNHALAMADIRPDPASLKPSAQPKSAPVEGPTFGRMPKRKFG